MKYNEEDLQRELNSHLRRTVVFYYGKLKMSANLDLTIQKMASLKFLDVDVDIDTLDGDVIFHKVQDYLRDEGFFEYELRA